MRRPSIPSLLIGLLVFAIAVPAFAQREKLPPEDLAIIKEKYPEAKRTITGLRYIQLQEGHGEPAHAGDMVSVLYKGELIDGKVFNEVKDPKDPFTFRLGRGQVIDGWDEGLKLMREGSKFLFVVPHELGYGTRGNPPVVGRQATLIFQVEMIKIERNTATPPPTPAPTKKGKKVKEEKPKS